MLPFETLSAHYREYASQSDEWVRNMELTKRSIVSQTVKVVGELHFPAIPRIVVLGASDKRYIPIHERIFSDVLKSRVAVTTLDADRAHLGSGKDVVQHDVTTWFPVRGCHIVFSHELLKFLTEREQLLCLQHSHAALAQGGFAMHVMHEPALKGTAELRSWQYRVNLRELTQALGAININTELLDFQSESTVSWLKPTAVLLLRRK